MVTVECLSDECLEAVIFLLGNIMSSSVQWQIRELYFDVLSFEIDFKCLYKKVWKLIQGTTYLSVISKVAVINQRNSLQIIVHRLQVSSLTKLSPTQVLNRLIVAQFRWSDRTCCFQHDLIVSSYKVGLVFSGTQIVPKWLLILELTRFVAGVI